MIGSSTNIVTRRAQVCKQQMSLESYIRESFTWGEIYDMANWGVYHLIPKERIPSMYKEFSDELWNMAWTEWKSSCLFEATPPQNILGALSHLYAADNVESQSSFEEWLLEWGIRSIAGHLIAIREGG